MSEEGTEVAVAQDIAGSVLSVIVRAASDPAVDVAKMQALLDMQERLLARQAEIEFNEALSRLPAIRVKKNGRVDLGVGKGSYNFAKWEDIDRIIRPLLTAEGFTLAFDSAPRVGEGGGIVVTGTLQHRNGHHKSASMPLALDAGAGRNNLQAMGSTLSYGKRYTAEMLLNIVREGEDDDAATAEPISDEEAAELSRALTETKSNLDIFLRFMGVAAIPDIQRKDLTRARNALEQKRQRGKS